MEELTENQRLLKLIEEKLKSDRTAMEGQAPGSHPLHERGPDAVNNAPAGGSGEAFPKDSGEERKEPPGEAAPKPPDEMFDSWDEFLRN